MHLLINTKLLGTVYTLNNKLYKCVVNSSSVPWCVVGCVYVCSDAYGRLDMKEVSRTTDVGKERE